MTDQDLLEADVDSLREFIHRASGLVATCRDACAARWINPPMMNGLRVAESPTQLYLAEDCHNGLLHVAHDIGHDHFPLVPNLALRTKTPAAAPKGPSRVAGTAP